MATQCVIDCWGTCLDAGMSGSILSCNLVLHQASMAAHGFSSHNCVTKKQTISSRRKN